jgi:outer membrane protein assembly factor BamD (BamD/ComL family)
MVLTMFRSGNPLGLMLALSCLGLGALPTAQAAPEEVYAEESPRGGFLSWFSRPAQPTPPEQLAYADALHAQGKIKAAGRQYRNLVRAWPGSIEAPVAQRRYAVAFRERGKLRDAFDAYQDLIDQYPGRFPHHEVLQEQFDIAVETMNRRRARFLFIPGFYAPERALEMFQDLLRNGPRWEKAPEVAYTIGFIQEHVGDWELAIVSYMDAMLRFPESSYAERAAYGRARCLVELSDGRPYDMETAEEAWYAMSLFNSTYPDSEHGEEARAAWKRMRNRLAQDQFQVARYYDQIARQPRAALVAYQTLMRRYGAGSSEESSWTEEARARIESLKAIVETEDEN